jgi:energy-coupling factor transporter ATP-binding protein EcfA2
VIARGEFEPALRALENWIRAAVAWRAAAHGGALVHAASAVRRGRAYLFYGESGAGKSTLSASTRRATIVSDDLSLVLPGEGGRLELVGSTFPGTHGGEAPVIGRFPVAAAFRLVKAAEAAIVPVPRVLAFAQLVGNLIFVAEASAVRPDILAAVERAFAKVPLGHLRFRKDDSFWDAIDAAGL